jgi:peptidase S41-like protein
MRRRVLISWAFMVPALALSASPEPPKPGWLVPERPGTLEGRVAPGGRPAPQSTDWCGHLVGGPRGTRAIPIDLSAAHAAARTLSVESPYGVSDTALTQALDFAGPLDEDNLPRVLERYAEALGDVCAVPAERGTLGRARVHRLGRLALVVPGTGEATLPSGTEAVVVDLRNLPAVDELDAALARAVAPALLTQVSRPTRMVRAHDGPVDEVASAFNVYSTYVQPQPPEHPYTGSGDRDLPLIFVTGERMPAAAAAFAGVFRLAGLASILGADVWSEVAESEWHGVDRHGLAVRTGFFARVTRLNSPARLGTPVVTQDDPDDPGSATFRWDVVMPEGASLIDVVTKGQGGTDLDLFLLHDADGDGEFRFPAELAASSASPTADEHVTIVGTPNPSGRYQVWVHGRDVPDGASPFELSVDVALAELWPDQIPADARLRDEGPSSVIGQARRLLAAAPGPVSGDASRSFPAPVHPFGVRQPVATGKPEARAALLIAHGMTRQFFPYFDVVGDTIDERLLETLQAVEDWDGADRRGFENVLRRFGEALRDGHQFVSNYGPPTFAGFLPVFLDELEGRPVVRRSSIPEIGAGDTILSIDGRPIEEVYAEQYRMTSAATPGWRFDVASRFVSRLTHPVRLVLADPDGAEREVSVAPQPGTAYSAAVVPGVTGRASGPLDDLGAPGVYYLNMSGYVSPTMQHIRGALQEATALGAAGLVVDMRNYPGVNHYEVAARLVRQRFLSPQFHIWQSLDRAYQVSQFSLTPLEAPAWSGPIVLLTGPHAVSAAENFMQMLVGAGRLTAVIGEHPSAGTNGNITGVQLPGGFGFSYTGMRVLNPDGSRHHGVGIVPTVDTTLSPADLRDGVDRDLLAAIELLN